MLKRIRELLLNRTTQITSYLQVNEIMSFVWHPLLTESVLYAFPLLRAIVADKHRVLIYRELEWRHTLDAQSHVQPSCAPNLKM